MNQVVTTGIVMSRTNYGEADRIVTFITPDYGKLSVIAKGVRRPKSKLAGGIELFCISEISVLQGRGQLGTLTSSRLTTHFNTISSDLERSDAAYELLRITHKTTSDFPDQSYYDLLSQGLALLAGSEADVHLVELWFLLQLLQLEGRLPNLTTDTAGKRLLADQTFTFLYDDMGFSAEAKASFSAAHIKLLRLLSVVHKGQVANVKVQEIIAQECLQLIKSVFSYANASSPS